MPAKYISGDERVILNEILRPSNKHIKKGCKRPMPKRKYKLLFDIVQKVILGIILAKTPSQLRK